MHTTVDTLLLQAITQQQQRNAAALNAIESRAHDIATLDRLVRNLRARGWKVEPLVETEPAGGHAVCRLTLLLSCSESELADVLEHLGTDGVGIDRRVVQDLGCSRHYTLRLATYSLRLVAYVHTPARVAA
jgi:hypothetical protein